MQENTSAIEKNQKIISTGIKLRTPNALKYQWI
jgi:hypothetical protein